MTKTDRHSKFLNDLRHCLLLSQTTVMYNDVCTSTCPRLHVVARLCSASIVTLCYTPINHPKHAPIACCASSALLDASHWTRIEQMLSRAGLVLAISCYDGLCCVVVNSGVMSGTLHKRTSSSNFTWCGHREGHQLCLLAAKPHIL